MKRNYLIFFMLALLGYLSGFAQEESSKPVYNETKQTGYDDFAAAWAATADGDVLIVNTNQDINARMDVGAKNLTVKGANKNIVIKGKDKTKGMFLVNNSGGNSSLTLESITIDGNNDNQKDAFEVSAKNTNILKIKDVIFQNFKIYESGNNKPKAVIVAKSNGKFELENVEFKNIVNETANKGCVFVGTPGSSITGTFAGSICIEMNGGNNTVNVSGISVGSNKVNVYLNKLSENNNVLTNVSNPDDFVLKNASYKFDNSNGTLKVVQDPDYHAPTAVTIEGGESYNSLKEAYDASTDNDIIIVNENQNLTDRFTLEKSVTIKGKTIDVVISTTNTAMPFLARGNKKIVLESLTLDGCNKNGTNNIIAIENNAELTLNDVVLKNFASNTADKRLIYIKAGKVHLNGVKKENCNFKVENGDVDITGTGSTINGDNDLSIHLSGTNTIAVPTDGTLSNTEPIMLYFDDSLTAGATLVTNCTDAAKFDTQLWDLKVENNSVVLDKAKVFPTEVVIENKIGGYSTFKEAYEAAADGDVIIVNVNQNLTEQLEGIDGNRLRIADKNLTIKGGAENVTLTYKNGNQAYVIYGKNVTFENLTLDGDNASGKNYMAVENNGILTLKNVKIANYTSTETNNKLINLKKENGRLNRINIEDVTVDNVKVPEGVGMLNINEAGSTINGNTNLSIQLNGNITDGVATIMVPTEGSLTNTDKIMLYFDDTLTEGIALVTNCKDITKFAVRTPGFILEADETNNLLRLAVDPDYVAPTMVTIEGGKTFDSLKEALEKAADGDVLLINKDITDLNERILINKAVTIKGSGEGSRVITNKHDQQAVLVVGKTVSIENITFDGGGLGEKFNFIGVENDGQNKAGVLTLRNVKIQNYKFGKGTNKLIHVKNSTFETAVNAIHLENVTVENVAGPEDQGMLNINSIGSTISGNNNVSIHLNGKNTIAVTGDLTNGAEAPIEIYVSDHEAGDAVVTDCQALDRFKVMTPGFILATDEANNSIRLAEDPDYVAPTKVTIEGGKTFDSLTDALSKAKNGDVLIVNENLELTDRLFIDKAVTIKAREDAEIIISSSATNQAFIFNSQGKMAVENIIFDGMEAKGPNFIAVEKDNSDLTLKNVRIRNYSFSGTNLLINVKKSEKAENQIAIHLDGVTVENVTGPDNMMMLNINGDGSTINGNNNISIKLNGTTKLAVPEGGALTNESPMIVSVGSHQKNMPIVENCGEAFRFMAMFWKLAVVDNNVVLAEAEEFPTTVTIDGKTGGYATLEEAVAAASDGDVILVNEPIEIFDTENNVTKRLTIDKAVTIKGGLDGIVITNKHKVQAFLISGKHVTFENITLDGNGAKGENYIGVENNNGALTLRDFKLMNYTFENKNGNKLIHVKGGNGNAIHLENALAVNVSGPDGVGMININTDGSTLSGDNNMSIHLNGTSTVAVAEGKELTHTGMITVYTTDHDVTSPVVTNCTDTDLFQVPGWEIRSDGSNIVLDRKSAISEIEAGDDSGAPVEFYNLQGVKVSKANLVPGIYIRKQGKKTTKIIIR